MPGLQIYDPRERALVAAADLLLAASATVARPFRRRSRPRDPQRILLLRLERIGDLLMALPGIAAVRALAPRARIDLVVGSWNAELAGAITSVDRVYTRDAQWLARDGGGLRLPQLFRAAGEWRKNRYDLAINFEPDVRSNLVVASARARWTAGYRSAGGGPLLDQALDYDPASHTADNAVRLVQAVFGSSAPAVTAPLLDIPPAHRQRAKDMLASARRPIVAMHVSGGRAVKQWDPDRFADVARRLAMGRNASIVLTGSGADRDLVGRVIQALPAGTAVDASRDESLLTLAALLAESDILITGDTGPMHVAAAVGTPIVAVFGPSDPRRYAPRGAHDRVVRVDLPCAPCNRIRLPPARCTGHTPDCLALVSADRVLDAAVGILDQCAPGRARNASA